jgi:hypothetical protein
MQMSYAIARMRHQPRFNKRPARKLPRLAYDLVFAKAPSAELDRRVFETMRRFVTLKQRLSFTSDLGAAISLIPDGWWWHLSHLEAKVTPTSPVKGAEKMLSNGHRYDDRGRPIGYDVQMYGERDRIPLALCGAIVLAVASLNEASRFERGKTTPAIEVRAHAIRGTSHPLSIHPRHRGA